MDTTQTIQSIQQTTANRFHTLIKEKTEDKTEILKIIIQILESSNINVYSNFLHLPEITELKKGSNEKYYHTLYLFAFGTYCQYLENKEKLLNLTPIMDKKLKHLTILSLAIQKKTLPYDDLMKELDIKNVRDLEDIIIEAIYAELINGKLDQKNRQLEIDYAVARDIQVENIKEIITILNDWLKSCESCSNCLQDQIEKANGEKSKRLKHKEWMEEQLVVVKKNLKTQSQQPNYQDEDDSYILGTEKNLNTKEKRHSNKEKRSHQAGPSNKNWFKNF